MTINKTLLHVEDEVNWHEIIYSLLKDEGLDFQITTTYSDALDKILRTGGWFTAYDLCLCVVDLRLGSTTIEENYDGMGLLAVCEKRQIPTIVVSGYLTKRLREQLISEYGVSAVFEKGPVFEDQAFLGSVRRAIASYDQKDGHFQHQVEFESIEFRLGLQNLNDTVIDYYKRAHALINDRQRERKNIRGKSSLEDEKLWQFQIEELDRKFGLALSRIKKCRTIKELNELHPEIIKECMEWLIL